ncbi:MAG: tRNA lysidine(34) synthetase TilS [Desulfobacterales bacterium]|nr:tRNA lysidine(34) synthetase TilS [Desulfobacterales bacterium]
MSTIAPIHIALDDPLLQALRATIARESMLIPGDGVLVGVSGGRDSMVLLALLARLAGPLRLRLGIAHFHHGLRGATADRDAGLVAHQALAAGLPFFYARGDAAAHRRRHRLSLEEASRELRYTFFETTARRYGFGCVALGHHADDNAELVLMRLLRGSGPLGLAGIPPVRALGSTGLKVIRPLIDIDQALIERFSRRHGIATVEDESNRSLEFTRNRIRHDLLPKLRADYNPGIAAGLNRLARLMRDEDAWLALLGSESLRRATVAADADHLLLDRAALEGCHPALQRRLLRAALEHVRGDLRRIGFEAIEAVRRRLDTRNPADGIDLPGGVRVETDGDRLRIGRRRPAAATVPFEYTVRGTGVVDIAETGARLCLEKLASADVGAVRLAGQSVAYFDMDQIEFPITIRNFRPGDRFAPFGLQGTQKLKKYFIDHKIPRDRRRDYPLVVSGGEIIWIAGLRRSGRAPIAPGSAAILKLELLVA